MNIHILQAAIAKRQIKSQCYNSLGYSIYIRENKSLIFKKYNFSSPYKRSEYCALLHAFIFCKSRWQCAKTISWSRIWQSKVMYIHS